MEFGLDRFELAQRHAAQGQAGMQLGQSGRDLLRDCTELIHVVSCKVVALCELWLDSVLVLVTSTDTNSFRSSYVHASAFSDWTASTGVALRKQPCELGRENVTQQ